MRTRPELTGNARSFPAHPSMLHEVRRFVRDRCYEAGMHPSATDDLVLAVSEACANAVLHSKSGVVQVAWRAGAEHVEVEVADQGVFRRTVPLQEVEGVHGHGIQLMMALMDEVTVREGTIGRPGTVVRLVKLRAS
ncbi:MAG TPA: ATP-binding protein [Actinomycetota bacterium]